MVFIIDEGSEFSVPLYKVWEYNQSQNHRHRSLLNPERSMEGNQVFLSWSTKAQDGSIVKNKAKLTPLPPLGSHMEFTEGPMAGSTVLSYYTPKGNKTGITVVCEIKTAGVPDKELREMTMNWLETMFNEDEANLKEMADA
jgi:hypothetical protein